MASPGPIIEVAGIDGAGKSTLAAHLSGHYIRAGHITFVRSFHSWVRRWADAVAGGKDTNRSDYFGMEAVEFATAVEMMERSQLLRPSAASGSIFVLDPYIFCSAAMAASFGITNLPAVIETYLAGTVPDLVVYLDLDERVAMRRIRDRSSVDNLVLSTYGEPPLGQFRAALDKVEPMFVEGGVPVLRLDGEASIEDNVLAVAEELSRR